MGLVVREAETELPGRLALAAEPVEDAVDTYPVGAVTVPIREVVVFIGIDEAAFVENAAVAAVAVRRAVAAEGTTVARDAAVGAGTEDATEDLDTNDGREALSGFFGLSDRVDDEEEGPDGRT